MALAPLVTTDETLEPGFVRVKLTRKGHQYRGNREGSELVVYHTEADNLIKSEMATLVNDSRTRVTPWQRVEIVAAEGTQFGVVSQAEGVLVLSVKQAGESWPGGEGDVPQGGFNEIAEGASRYTITQSDKPNAQ